MFVIMTVDLNALLLYIIYTPQQRCPMKTLLLRTVIAFHFHMVRIETCGSLKPAQHKDCVITEILVASSQFLI